MKVNAIRRIVVVGGGSTVHQFALVAALAGSGTSVTDVNGDVLARWYDFAEGRS